jgi:hypothetical protein
MMQLYGMKAKPGMLTALTVSINKTTTEHGSVDQSESREVAESQHKRNWACKLQATPKKVIRASVQVYCLLLTNQTKQTV